MDGIKPLVRRGGHDRQGVISISAVIGLRDELDALGPALNDIGVPGSYGFGVGVCPPNLLPTDLQELSGTRVAGHENYGNYICKTDGSIVCYVPAYWYRIGHANNVAFPEHGPNSVDILPLNSFESRAQAALQGFAIERAFVDGGQIQPGFFYDKYKCSNNNGVASSLRYGNPLSSNSAHNPFAALNGAPANAYYGAIDAAKTRGDDWFCSVIFMKSAVARLSLAHGQQTKGVACAWHDPAGIINFPKGCNNNALRDVNDTSVLYSPDGYQNCGKTGSGVPFDKTTHNGQACGIADVNGLMWEISPGFTSQAARYYVLKESVRVAELTGGNTLSTDLWGSAGLAANYDDVGATWGGLTASGTTKTIGSINQVFSSDTAGLGWQMAGVGIPLATGIGGHNQFGNDGLWDYRPNDMCPVAVGHWSHAASAGAFARHFSTARAASYGSVGFRSALWPVAARDSGQG